MKWDLEKFIDKSYRRWLKSIWDKYWEIIVAIITGFIIGIILPNFFK
jgi:uncharacterized membrane protein YraQ (UPF0718 family)